MCFGTEYPKRRGWPSCKQTQDARREVDCRAAKGHSTPHPSCRGGREVTGALGDVCRAEGCPPPVD